MTQTPPEEKKMGGEMLAHVMYGPGQITVMCGSVAVFTRFPVEGEYQEASRFCNGMADRINAADAARVKVLVEGLETIQEMCDDEIKARGFNEEKDHKSAVLSLLRMPRNIARQTLEVYRNGK